MPASDAHVSRPTPAFLGLDEVVVVDNVVTPAEQDVVGSWADEQRRADRLLIHPIDPATRSTPFLSAANKQLTPLTQPNDRLGDSALVWVPNVDLRVLDPLPEEFWAIRTRVIARLGIDDLSDDPYKGSFLTSVAPGGDVHTHKDARLWIDGDLRPLLRCNVMVRRPDAGGMPVIEGTEFDIPDRGLWALHPTENIHGATSVAGPTSRVTLSFGFVVNLRAVWERSLCVAQEVEPAVLHGVRAHLRGQPMDPARARTIDRLLDQSAVFRVREVAEALGCDPALVWGAARQLLKLGLLRSEAPKAVPNGCCYAL
jgi:hypothetical protein